MKHYILTLGLAACTARAAWCAELHVDDFQTGTTTLGWSGGAAPTRVATGGPAGDGDAFLRITASAGGHLATYTDATSWVGNLASISATAVKVDLMAPPTSAPLPMRLVLFGPGSNFDRWTSVEAQLAPNDGVWRSYTFGVGASDLTRVLGSGAYEQLMASTLRVMLRYDPGAPTATGPGVASPGGVLNMDNIALAGAVTPPLAGDFNGDGSVDEDDLEATEAGWKARFGVDLEGEDFLIWQRNFGAANGATAEIVTVPEPGLVGFMWGIMLTALPHVTRRPLASPPRRACPAERAD